MKVFVDVMAVASVVLALYCSLPYWQSIVQGRTKPHQFSWLIFMIMNSIVAISQFLAGGRASVLISGMFAAASFVNFALSMKYGVRGSSRFDRLLLAGALLTIAAWLLTGNNGLAIWLTVAIDIFATAMIVLKVLGDHTSEAPGPWLIATFAFICSCLTLIDRPLSILWVRPVYGVLSDFAVIAAIWVGRARSRKTVSSFPPT